jgi:hypothetical protein
LQHAAATVHEHCASHATDDIVRQPARAVHEDRDRVVAVRHFFRHRVRDFVAKPRRFGHAEVISARWPRLFGHRCHLALRLHFFEDLVVRRRAEAEGKGAM